MYAAMLLNVAGIPFGAGAVFSALGGWVVVAAFLAAALVLTACVDRTRRLTWSERGLRWVTTARVGEGFWGFRLRCAEVTLKNV